MKFKTLKFEKNKHNLFIGLVGLTFLIVIAIIIGRSFAFTPELLGNQVVDGLSFENANLECKDGISTFTADVYNENDDVYALKYINIEFVDSQNKTTTLIGYIGEVLEKEEQKFIRASVDTDLSDSKRIVYSIQK